MFPVHGSMSAQTTVPPSATMGVLVAIQVIGVEITSSPAPTPASRSARWSAEVPLLTVSTWGVPNHSRGRVRSVDLRALADPTRQQYVAERPDDRLGHEDFEERDSHAAQMNSS
jgi:hypothetical protein